MMITLGVQSWTRECRQRAGCQTWAGLALRTIVFERDTLRIERLEEHHVPLLREAEL